jgi:hypothetical protein
VGVFNVFYKTSLVSFHVQQFLEALFKICEITFKDSCHFHFLLQRVDIREGKEHIGFREMDAVKNKLGVEVQFGKYAFMIYNVAAKMTIFAKRGIIDSGIEIVPMLSLANEMSSGVSYFEQIKTDLECRGVSNIDIPILILGVDAVKRPRQFSLKEFVSRRRTS